MSDSEYSAYRGLVARRERNTLSDATRRWADYRRANPPPRKHMPRRGLLARLLK